MHFLAIGPSIDRNDRLFHILQLIKSLPSHIPEAWQRHLFRAEPPRKAPYRERYPWEAIIWVALEEKACVNVSWRRLAQIKQLAWPMAERQIEHRKSCYPVVNWRSRPVAKSAYYFFNTYRPRVLEIFFLRSKNLLWPTSCPPSLILLFLKHSNTIALLLILGFQASS